MVNDTDIVASTNRTDVEPLPWTALRPWAVVTLLYRRDFRGSYNDVCALLGWYDHRGNGQRSIVCCAMRKAKELGEIPQDANLRPDA
jgi:hypothetical protein